MSTVNKQDPTKAPSTSDIESTGSTAEQQAHSNRRNFFKEYIDSFRAPIVQASTKEKLAWEERNNEHDLHRTLSNRHVQMMAVGGAIGAGLFIASGKALNTGGPGSLLIAFLVNGLLMFGVMNAICELAISYPSINSVYSFVEKLIEPSWGFALGWLYLIQWIACIPLQIVATGMTLMFYEPPVHIAVFLTVFYIAIILLNFVPVRQYGEVEAFLCYIKLIAIAGFLILGTIIICGGTPKNGYLGAHTWHDPGAFANGFKGFVTVFLTAAFSYTGTELVGLASTEAKDPIKTVTKASRQIVFRIGGIYIIMLFLLGLIVPYTDSRIFSGSNKYDAKASPFVIAMEIAGINVLPQIFNAVILIAVLSVGVSGVWAASRSLNSLANVGYAPAIFKRLDRSGRPMIANLFCLMFGALCYVQLSSNATEVFVWLTSLIGVGSLINWFSICVCHIRFRKVLKLNGISTDELAYKAALGTVGSYIGAILSVVIIIGQFYVSISPLSAQPGAYSFFQSFLGFPLAIFAFLGRKVWKRSKFIRTRDINVDKGRKLFTQDELILSRSYWDDKPWYKRLFMYII